MSQKLRDGGEFALFILLGLFLYGWAIPLFPLFRDPYGILVLVFEEGFLPFPPPMVIFLSALPFALGGALMAHWVPALSYRRLTSFWVAIFLVYWADPVMGFLQAEEGWKSAVTYLLGGGALVLFFLLADTFPPEERPHYQADTWRSRWAGWWLIVWMGFFAGLSAILLPEVLIYPLHRVPLVLATLGMAFWAHRLAVELRRAQGEEAAGVVSLWPYVVGLWFILAAIHFFFRAQTTP